MPLRNVWLKIGISTDIICLDLKQNIQNSSSRRPPNTFKWSRCSRNSPRCYVYGLLPFGMLGGESVRGIVSHPNYFLKKLWCFFPCSWTKPMNFFADLPIFRGPFLWSSMKKISSILTKRCKSKLESFEQHNLDRSGMFREFLPLNPIWSHHIAAEGEALGRRRDVGLHLPKGWRCGCGQGSSVWHSEL